MVKRAILIEYIFNKSKCYTITSLIQGETQKGKSTSAWKINDILSRRRFGEPWDWTKYCARSLEEFVDIFDKSENRFIVYEEASKDINVATWYDLMNKLFNILLQTQAYKHNSVMIVMPQSLGISKRQRRFINLGMEVVKKIDTEKLKATLLKPTIYKRTYWKLDEDDLRYVFLPMTYIKYTEEDLAKSREYTQWLIDTLKADVMADIKRQLKKIKKNKRIAEGKIDMPKVEKPIKIRW